MKLELLDFIELENYPSGTGIEFYDDKIYIVGDQSREVLVMTKKWTKPTLVNLFATLEKKASKPAKSELEAMTILSVDKKPHLLIIGSGTTDKRNNALLFNLKTNTVNWIDLSLFYNRIRSLVKPDINIEGIAEVYDYLVMVNRGTAGNQLLITRPDFWKAQEKASLQSILIAVSYTHLLVKRDKSTRAHYYTAALSQEKTQKHLVGKMIEGLFGGSPARLGIQALGNYKASEEEIEEIQQLLNNLKK